MDKSEWVWDDFYKMSMAIEWHLKELGVPEEKRKTEAHRITLTVWRNLDLIDERKREEQMTLEFGRPAEIKNWERMAVEDD